VSGEGGSDFGAPDDPMLGQVLYDAARIAARVAELGAAIDRDHGGKVPVLVTVLRGATVFASDLARAMRCQHEMDFLAVSAFGGAAAGDHVRVLKDLQVDVRDRPVVLVEDVVDTGLTLGFLLRWLRAHGPSSVDVCTLLDRPHRRLVESPIRYSGFRVPDRFYVGYGFDYRQRYRNLPDLVELRLDDPVPLLSGA
jgi:hypoxanthine phosphoribosyltransferase